MGRIGLPKILISDCYVTFKKVNTDLEKAWKNLESEEFSNYLSENKIEWKFIVQYAPFWGGFYERLVRSIKLPLRKVLGNAKINTEEFNTILISIESILNNRPITYIYNTPEEFSPLCPSHFLVGSRLDCLPEIYLNQDGKSELIDRYNLLEEMKKSFWDQWSKDYLPELIKFSQSRKTNVKNIEIGDIILVENDKKRGQWKLGKVESLLIGKDGKARAAIVKTQSKKLIRRPIQKLYPLEISAEVKDDIRKKVRSDNSHQVMAKDKSIAPARNRVSDALSDDVFEVTTTGSADFLNPARSGRGEVVASSADLSNPARSSHGGETARSVDSLNPARSRRGRIVKVPGKYKDFVMN